MIVQVTTRPAPEQDIDALDRIHLRLHAQGFQQHMSSADRFYGAYQPTPDAATPRRARCCPVLKDSPGSSSEKPVSGAAKAASPLGARRPRHAAPLHGNGPLTQDRGGLSGRVWSPFVTGLLEAGAGPT
ncbi:hypothetical protein ABT084_08700 [Streptomyces sp. NPDC002138]|uniref:hypothetical protein n=1 Tax=Streptomyces sp. NPDC002138 TaxID=3154410 RepID=UPI0033211DF8